MVSTILVRGRLDSAAVDKLFFDLAAQHGFVAAQQAFFASQQLALLEAIELGADFS